MFKRISLLPILVGGAGGFLSAAIAAVFFWALLLLIGADETALTGGIVLGVVVGTFVSGFVAGNAHPRAVFHGALTGVALAGGITIVALGEGSPASAGTQAGYVIGSGLLGALGGWAAERWRQRRRRKRTQTADESGNLSESSPGDRGRKTEESPDSTG